MSFDQFSLPVIVGIAVLLLGLIVVLGALKLPRNFFEGVRRREEIQRKIWEQRDKAVAIREQMQKNADQVS
jgi:hypothetical protein